MGVNEKSNIFALVQDQPLGPVYIFELGEFLFFNR